MSRVQQDECLTAVVRKEGFEPSRRKQKSDGDGGIRTLTKTVLSRSPLPIGIRPLGVCLTLCLHGCQLTGFLKSRLQFWIVSQGYPSSSLNPEAQGRDTALPLPSFSRWFHHFRTLNLSGEPNKFQIVAQCSDQSAESRRPKAVSAQPAFHRHGLLPTLFCSLFPAFQL